MQVEWPDQKASRPLEIPQSRSGSFVQPRASRQSCNPPTSSIRIVIHYRAFDVRPPQQDSSSRDGRQECSKPFPSDSQLLFYSHSLQNKKIPQRGVFFFFFGGGAVTSILPAFHSP